MERIIKRAKMCTIVSYIYMLKYAFASCKWSTAGDKVPHAESSYQRQKHSRTQTKELEKEKQTIISAGASFNLAHGLQNQDFDS